jgi:hypothetical protein
LSYLLVVLDQDIEHVLHRFLSSLRVTSPECAPTARLGGA